MWHEARRQERKIRGIMVDYKRRADRRREFYEKIKQDPAQFLRMYGRPVKIHLDPAVAMAAEGPQSMMPWQGDSTNMIDRFDVRANLDVIPEYTPDKNTRSNDLIDDEERLASYERYRTLVENEAAGLSEEQCLHQIYLDEHFGIINKTTEDEKKKNTEKKAAIGFVYEDSTPVNREADDSEDEESEEDLETADLDVTIDIDVLTPDQIKEVNICAAQYGMKDDDFSRLLRKDKEELEALREAKQLEEAKAQFSGRKSRRERRAINEKRQNPQRFSRPSYAARESPKYEPYKRPGSSSHSRSRSRSRSRSSEAAPVTFITSFGADSDSEGIVQGPALPIAHKPTVKKGTSSPDTSKCETPWLSGPSSHRNQNRSRSNRSSSRSRSRSRSWSRGRRQSDSSKSSLSSSRSRSRSKSFSRSRSWSINRQSSSIKKGSNGGSSQSRSKRRKSRSASSSLSCSRSRSRSRSSYTKSSRRSESPTKKTAVKRYRRESLSSQSELSGLESDEEAKKSTFLSQSTKTKTPLKNETIYKSESSKSGKISSKPQHFQSTNIRETPQERLKRRMQAQLSRQFKADKKAEITKITKQEQERLDREEEIRTLALEMRRREREKRHKEREEEEKERKERRRSRHSGRSSGSSSSDSDSSRSESDSFSPVKSRSPQKSPEKKRDDNVRRKPDIKGVERKEELRKDDRRKDAPLPSTEDRKRSDDRKWEGRREHSRWDGESARGQVPHRSGRGSENSRWDGPPGPRWNSSRYDGAWGPDQHMWDGGPGDWGDGPWQNRPPPPPHYNSRSRHPLLQRPSSPLMSRPRPPNDPNLMDEPMNFD